MTVKLLIRLLPCLLVLGFGAAALPGGSTNGLWNRERWLWVDGGEAVRQRLGAALVAAYFGAPESWRPRSCWPCRKFRNCGTLWAPP